LLRHTSKAIIGSKSSALKGKKIAMCVTILLAKRFKRAHCNLHDGGG